jgi:hypothetical protein
MFERISKNYHVFAVNGKTVEGSLTLRFADEHMPIDDYSELSEAARIKYKDGYLRYGVIEIEIEGLGLTGSAYLGGVFYETEEDLWSMVHEFDMIDEAQDSLISQARTIIEDWRDRI